MSSGRGQGGTPDPLRARSPKERLEANLENFRAFWRAYGQTPGGKVHESGGTTWFKTGVRDGIFNGVLRTDFPEERSDEEIRMILEAMHGLPFTWNVGPDSRPRDLARRLEAHGLEPLFDIVGMSADLDRLSLEAPDPPGVRIEVVQHRAGLETFAEVASGPFQIRSDAIGGLTALEAAQGFDPRARRRYLAFLDERPVATTVLFLAAGVGGIYVVATVPDARGRGIGAAITRRAMREARDLGYRMAVLQASPMGHSLYRRLGFRDDFSIGLHVADASA